MSNREAWLYKCPLCTLYTATLSDMVGHFKWHVRGGRKADREKAREYLSKPWLLKRDVRKVQL